VTKNKCFHRTRHNNMRIGSEYNLTVCGFSIQKKMHALLNFSEASLSLHRTPNFPLSHTRLGIIIYWIERMEPIKSCVSTNFTSNLFTECTQNHKQSMIQKETLKTGIIELNNIGFGGVIV